MVDAFQRADTTLQLRLYVNSSSNLFRGISEKIQTILEKNIKNKFFLEIIDVKNNPNRLRQDNVTVLPTLIKLEPGTETRMVGDISDESLVLDGIGIKPCSRGMRLKQTDKLLG